MTVTLEYGLLVVLILLFLFSYFASGRDFFAPTTMMVLSFLLACIFAISVCRDANYHIRSETAWLIAAFLLAGVITGFLCRSLVSCFRVRQVQESCTPLSGGFILFSILFALLTAYVYLRFIRQVGGGRGSFTQIMSAYRSASSYSVGGIQTPTWMRQMMNFLNAIFYIHSFDLLYHHNSLRVWNKCLHLLVMALALGVSLLTGGRANAIGEILGFLVLSHFVRIQKLGSYRTYSLSFLLKMVAGVLLAAALFYWAKEMVGRTSDAGFLDYIARYFGTGILNLDLFLKSPPAGSRIWGKETFYAVIQFLRRFGLLDVPYYLVHREFRILHGVSLGNVYTMFRGLIYDFGTAGALVFFVLQCILVSILYEVTKRKKASTWMLCFANLYYAFPLASFNDSFYSSVVSVGFCIKCVMILVLYALFCQKRIRIVMGKKRRR